MQGIDNKDCGVWGFTREHIVVDWWNPEGAADKVHSAVEVLVGVEQPGVAEAEALEDFS